ncbi:MAG: QueT transporter family protein [Oscillospiraceae bacterium]|jgi:uncharacterized membrane protein
MEASNLKLRRLASSAVLAALYASLTVALAGISYGEVQFRIAEALCVLPFFLPETAWGLFVGCIIANIVGGNGLPDIVFGSLSTLLACFITSKIRIKWLAPLPPVLINAAAVGAMLAMLYYPAELFWESFGICALSVGFGEAVVCYGLGLPLILVLERTKIMRKIWPGQ